MLVDFTRIIEGQFTGIETVAWIPSGKWNNPGLGIDIQYNSIKNE